MDGQIRQMGQTDTCVSGHDSETSSLQDSLQELYIPKLLFSVLKRCLCLAEKNNSKTECKIRFILKRGQGFL